MGRRGWSAAPDGWVQYIRGPREPAQAWPKVGRSVSGPQPPLDVDRSVPQVHHQSREAHQGVGCPTRGGECSVHQGSGPVVLSESGEQVLSLRHMVNVLQSERDALAKELHEARCGADDPDTRPAVKKHAVSRQVGSRRDPRCTVPVMRQFVPNEVTTWLQDRQAEQHEALLQGD